MEIKLTADFILDKMSHTMYMESQTEAGLVCDQMINYWLIREALEQLNVVYTEAEGEWYDDGTVDSYFFFKLKDIKKECPITYKKLYSLTKAAKRDETIDEVLN